jgi:hypothetical protein
MITGSHSIIYSADAPADIAFFKDVLKFSNVDVGNGWLIFGLPPSEIAVHPAEENGPPGFIYYVMTLIYLYPKCRPMKLHAVKLKTRAGDG